MAFSAAAVANRFLRLAWNDGKEITPLKMQKLVYFAHGWHLALVDRPLLSETIQAWQFGPVISSLYQAFKHFGAKPIQAEAMVVTQYGYLPAELEREAQSAEEAEVAGAVIGRVWDQYGKLTASQLTTMTHSQDSPWSQVPRKEVPERPIPDPLIAEYFKAQAGEQAAA